MKMTKRVPASGPDRTVFVRMSDGREIARYDRAGKWFVEYVDESGKPAVRRNVSVRMAARTAASDRRATVYVGLPGGSAFYHVLGEETVRSW